MTVVCEVCEKPAKVMGPVDRNGKANLYCKLHAKPTAFGDIKQPHL